MTFESTTSDADPGAGKIAFNNGTLSSVSILYVDDADDASADISGYVQSWDDVSNSVARGIVTITKEGTPSTYATFKISGGVTDASGYTKVPVTHVVSSGSFSDNDGVGVHFSYSGADAGSTDLVNDATPQLGGDLDLNSRGIDFPSTANVTDCKDEDNMASNSATMLATQQSIKAYVDAQPSNASYNGIINGDFSCWQRGTSFTSGSNNDDTCTASRWVLLSDGNDIVDVTRAAGDVDTGIYSIGLDVETVDKKFGIVQIIEQINCGQLGDIGTSPVSLSFKAKVAGSGKLDNVKAAVIAWSGTADSVTSDVVNAWNAEGTDPTLATSWTYENTPSNLSVTTSWVRYKIENISVDTSGTNNVAVFIWSDVTDTDAGDFLYIADVQLEPGATSNPFKRETHAATLSQCQRYYHRGLYAFMTSSATTCIFNINYPTTMRTSPTISHEYAEGGTANDIYNVATAATPTFVPNGSFGDADSYRFAYDFDAGLTADDGYQAYFYFEAEL